MSYANGTILVRNDEKDGDEAKYNKVRVVGPSPIRTSAAGEWTGGSGEQLIVEPIGSDQFAATEQIPIQALAEEFAVEYEPEPEPTHLETPRPPRAVRQLSPEEQLRKAAKDGYKGETERERTPIKRGR